MSLIRNAGLGAGLLSCFGCFGAAEVGGQVAIVVSVESDPGEPMRDVPIRIDGTVAGRTDRAGSFRTSLARSDQREVRIHPVCPEGFREPAEPSVLRLRSYRHDANRSSLEIRLACRPVRRRAAFVVRATGAPGIVVRLDGEIVARTNESGVAHFSSSAPAGTEYLIELDAPDHHSLLPRSTAHKLELPDADHVFIVEQKFEKSTIPRKRRWFRHRITRIE